MSDAVAAALQYGALGLLAVVLLGLGAGLWALIKVAAPAARDFLVGLTAEIKETREAVREVGHRIDLLEAKIVCTECDRSPCVCETRPTYPLRPAQRTSR